MEDNWTTPSAMKFQMETAVAIKIKASADGKMALPTHATDFIKWNSTVISVNGQIKQGEKKLVSKLEPKRTFYLKDLQ